jgi:DNA-directed RNA polymerase specialized sigma24 family protein
LPGVINLPFRALRDSFSLWVHFFARHETSIAITVPGMDRDTSIGGQQARFPTTRVSLLATARTEDPEARRRAYEILFGSYWKPTYKYIRVHWGAANEEAKDLTQGFFAKAFEVGFLERFDPAKARFRTWLRLCLDGFVANERKAAIRLKRGGPHGPLPLDILSVEQELKDLAYATPPDPDILFRREWVRSLFEQSLEEFRAECEAQGKRRAIEVFERYDLSDASGVERPSYADLAAEFGMPVTQITNYLSWARREFRRLVLAKLRASTGSEEEFRAEAREILGSEPL